MTYKQIYAVVNAVKPCRFTTRSGVVSFELIQPTYERPLVNEMSRAIKQLGLDFTQSETKTFSFPEGPTQNRTAFRVYKA